MEFNYTDDTKPKKLVGTFDPDNVKSKPAKDEPKEKRDPGERTIIKNDTRLPELLKQIMYLPGWRSKVNVIAHGYDHTGKESNDITDLSNKGLAKIKAACDFIRKYDQSKLSPGMQIFKEAMDKQLTNAEPKQKVDFTISSPTNAKITKWMAIKSDRDEHEGKVARAAARIETETDKFGQKIPDSRKMVVAYSVTGDNKTGYSPNTNEDPIFKVPLEEGKTLEDYRPQIKLRLNANVGELKGGRRTEYNKKMKAGSEWAASTLIGKNYDDILAEKIEKKEHLVKDIMDNGLVVDDETGTICKADDLPEGHKARQIALSDEDKAELRQAGINAQVASIKQTGEEDENGNIVKRYTPQSGGIRKSGVEKFSVDAEGKRKNQPKDPQEAYNKHMKNYLGHVQGTKEIIDNVPVYDTKREQEIEKNSEPVPDWVQVLRELNRR